MLLRLTRPLFGYSLCLCSWLMLTLGMPFSAALAVTDAGWMRICSSQGVHWLAPRSEPDGATIGEGCTCLSSPLATSSEPACGGAVYAASADLPFATPRFSRVLLARAQARAPPALQ
ncbi:hypothetical protein [Reinekea sp.]|jgi:hypothetical protein|uniref:hypothetical protein n=1 Tax=Reinekea sp. TaxID=1970455 RepID=UPI002A8081E8|nr:hypothetical protein [Reinekea sp.]